MNGFKLRVVRVFKLRSDDRLERVPRCRMDVVFFLYFFVAIEMVSGYHVVSKFTFGYFMQFLPLLAEVIEFDKRFFEMGSNYQVCLSTSLM